MTYAGMLRQAVSLISDMRTATGVAYAQEVSALVHRQGLQTADLIEQIPLVLCLESGQGLIFSVSFGGRRFALQVFSPEHQAQLNLAVDRLLSCS